jgi:hypothetical protein
LDTLVHKHHNWYIHLLLLLPFVVVFDIETKKPNSVTFDFKTFDFRLIKAFLYKITIKTIDKQTLWH